MRFSGAVITPDHSFPSFVPHRRRLLRGPQFHVRRSCSTHEPLWGGVPARAKLCGLTAEACRLTAISARHAASGLAAPSRPLGCRLRLGRFPSLCAGGACSISMSRGSSPRPRAGRCASRPASARSGRGTRRLPAGPSALVSKGGELVSEGEIVQDKGLSRERQRTDSPTCQY